MQLIFLFASNVFMLRNALVHSNPRAEELLAQREAWQKERKQPQEKVHSALGEIYRLRQIIASLQHKLFGNSKGETAAIAQLQMQLTGAKEVLV